VLGLGLRLELRFRL